MYTLYYLTKNLALNCMKVDSLDVCIAIPEDLIFISCRNGINFIKEPAKNLSFSDVERLIMSTEFYDTNFIKDEDFRKANSKMCPLSPQLGVFFFERFVFAKLEHYGSIELNADSSNMNIEFFASETIDGDDFLSLGNMVYEFRGSESHVYAFYSMSFETKRVYFLEKNSNTISRIFVAPPLSSWYQP